MVFGFYKSGNEDLRYRLNREVFRVRIWLIKLKGEILMGEIKF